MTQFMLGEGKAPELTAFGVVVRPAAMTEPVVRHAAAEWFAGVMGSNLWSLEPGAGGCTDDLFVAAQAACGLGTQFADTPLGAALAQLLRRGCRIVLWYGSEWQDLPSECDAARIIAKTGEALASGTGEVYLRSFK